MSKKRWVPFLLSEVVLLSRYGTKEPVENDWANTQAEKQEQEGGIHSGEYAIKYFYNGLCWIWQ